MNFKSFKVEVLNSMDATREAWLTSKPTIKYESEEELQETLNKMIEQDLPLSAFRQYHLRIESSLLFRDLLFTLRPCIAWSSSFRINPITPDRIFFEEAAYDDKDEMFIDAGMVKPYEDFAAGKALDVVKLDLFLATMTQYVISIDSRSLMCFIATLNEMDPVGFEDHIIELCKVLGYNSYSELPKTSANSLYSKLCLDDKTDYTTLEPIKDFDISEYLEDDLGFARLDVIVDASTGGQFLRQHFSILRNQLFDVVKDKGYKDAMMYKCRDQFRYVSMGQKENFDQLIRRRICWVVHHDHEYKNSGIISWSDILKPMIMNLNAHEFARLLPCRCNPANCSVSEETRLRLWKNKGIDGVVPDENPACPILIGEPDQVDERIRFYQSDSEVINKWKSLKENGILRRRDTKWKEEYEK